MARAGKNAGNLSQLSMRRCCALVLIVGIGWAMRANAKTDFGKSSVMPGISIKNSSLQRGDGANDATGYQCGVATNLQATSLSPYQSVRLLQPGHIDDIFATGLVDLRQSGPLRLADIAIVPAMRDAVLAYMQQNYRDVVAVVPLDGREELAPDRVPPAGKDPRRPVYFATSDGALWQEKLVLAGLAMVLPRQTDNKNAEISWLMPLPSSSPSPSPSSLGTGSEQDERRGGIAGNASAAMPVKTVKMQRGEFLSRLTGLEEAARHAKRGMWGQTSQSGREKGPLYSFAANHEAETAWAMPFAEAGIGQFAVVQGRLASVEVQQYRSYLNFGLDWRRDFTIALDSKQVAVLAGAGIALEDWIGRSVLVRGMIENRGGPYIAPTDLSSLCIGLARSDRN